MTTCAALLATLVATTSPVQEAQFQRPPSRPPVTQAAKPSDEAAQNFMEIATSVKNRSINLPGGAISYKAITGQIPLRNDAGEVECRMFYVAYVKDPESRSRPVMFAFNGGPGSASLWLHMGALGPKRAPLKDDGTLPQPPYEAVDNESTWLDFTDIVMVDAPGTGYSRIARQDLASKYFGVQPDIAAFTAFVRNWLTANGRWSSPVFIAGESYGGIRGSGLSNSLFQSGVAINGFISISGTSNFLTLDGMRGNDYTYIGFVPSMAATAWYHKRLPARFKSVEAVAQEVQAWIDKEYAPALQRGDSLSEKEKDDIAGELAQYLGISKKYVLGANLRVSEGMFFRELLRDDALSVGRYDSRIIGKEELKVGDRGAGDPSDDAVTPPFTSVINDYLTRDLQVKTDMPYLTFGSVNPWSEPQGSYAETASALRTVLARNPYFRVLYAMGYYDLACPFNATIYTVNHMGLDPESRSRVSYAYYPAGHMMYIEKSSRKKLHDDVKSFVEQSLVRK